MNVATTSNLAHTIQCLFLSWLNRRLVRACVLFILMCCCIDVSAQSNINRLALVQRHNIVITNADTLSSLTVGNGKFAFTADVTGLQTFPLYYRKGVPLGTQSEWGWHSFPNTEAYKEDETLQVYDLERKKITYAVQRKEPKRNKEASDYFRINQHRLQLGNVGVEILKQNGELITPNDVQNIRQQLDLWTGKITSQFTIEGVPVTVTTYAHQQDDAIAAKIVSPLLRLGRLKVRIRFPYPTGAFADEGTNYSNDEKHSSVIRNQTKESAIIHRKLDTTSYYVKANWKGSAVLEKKSVHYFIIVPQKSNSFEFAISFNAAPIKQSLSYSTTKTSSEAGWKTFWLSGGAVDFSGSADKRAFELERRLVLSQYLLRAQEAGFQPPQETGLTYNSWYGKPHMEMYWWHAAHYALWNRTDLLEKSLGWYFTAAKSAKAIAKRQGFDGVRWQKMTDNEGHEVPSSVGAFLVWQQPHFIYLAELVYRNKHDKKTLDKYRQLVFETADFMASFPTYDKANDRYNLGKGLIPAQECFNAETTFNPTYELAYWTWGLEVAQQWRKRSGLKRKKEWDVILKKLAPLPQKNGVYLATESTPDCYDADSKYTIDHPAVLAALSAIPPSNNLDTSVMLATYKLVDKVWHWDHTWGWDFPLIAMTATRLNQPALALDGLFKNIRSNTYLPNGHNYQNERLTIYLPGNGGILSAIALMCAGYDGSKIKNPGFPKDGSWKVRWEKLKPMP